MACLENAHRNGHWVCIYMSDRYISPAWIERRNGRHLPDLSPQTTTITKMHPHMHIQVILNNIHLMPRWLLQLEQKLDEFAQVQS